MESLGQIAAIVTATHDEILIQTAEPKIHRTLTGNFREERSTTEFLFASLVFLFVCYCCYCWDY